VKKRQAILVSAGVVAALALASAAAADVWQIHRTTAGDAKARAIVLKRADFGAATGWTGGFTSPQLTEQPPCGTFHPKQSDLVVVGASATQWKHTGLQVESRAVVLQTAAMVRLDWQRTVLAAPVLPCLRVGFAKQLPTGATLVSVKRVAFPQVAPLTTVFRVLIRVTSNGQAVDVFTDIIAIGSGPTEMTLQVTAPLAIDGNVHPAEVKLARVLAARAKT
jgi:hypothetical protein